MINILKRIKRFYNLSRKLKSIEGAWFLSANTTNYQIDSEKYDWQDSKLIIRKQDFYLTKEELQLFRNSLDRIGVFLDRFTFSREPQGLIVILPHKDREIKILLDNYEVVAVIKEIFIDQVYEIDTLKEFVVIDVGMNIGLSALYFASFKNVKKVIAFEPFEATFNRALQNFKLNPALSEKILYEMVGWGKAESIVQLKYNPDDCLSSTTIEGFFDGLKRNNHENFAEVRIRTASVLLKDIIDTYKDSSKIILKMDCEGAEYEIIEDLQQNDYLEKLDAIILEWHVNGNTPLIHALNNSNFFSLSQARPHTIPMGMIYAVKFS